jgi:hypothetical protein
MVREFEAGKKKEPSTRFFVTGSITRDPIFCSKARILLQVRNIFSGH